MALIGGILFVLFGWMVVTAVPLASAEALGEALMAGDWKAALIACTVLAVTLVFVWFARSAAGYIQRDHSEPTEIAGSAGVELIGAGRLAPARQTAS